MIEWAKEPFVARFLLHRSRCGRFIVMPRFGDRGAKVRWDLLDREGSTRDFATAAQAKAEAQKRKGGKP